MRDTKKRSYYCDKARSSLIVVYKECKVKKLQITIIDKITCSKPSTLIQYVHKYFYQQQKANQI